MSDIAIRVENLSKLYRIGRAQQRHDTLRDALVDFLPRMTRIARKNNSSNSSNSWPKDDTIWALRDVSFEVKRGEVVGIIGRNGAGKSTLLKILSRITEPTGGRAEIHGRVGSLLEVGTGFHPELTGRENIYLNGAILGMKRAEIDRKFDEIVAFAEIEKFLDTPVKRYSSGMYVRLAFAVAAHLEPEILLVDEVLAVGDAAFQKKCLGKMGDVAKEGRTVLFVSHNMGAISTLTQRTIFLDLGRIIADDLTEVAVSKYLSSSYRQESEWVCTESNSHPIQIHRIRVLNDKGNPTTELDVVKGFTVQVEYEVKKHVRGAVIAINLHAADGAHVLSLEDIDSSSELLIMREPGIYRSQVRIPGNLLNSGTYLLRVGSGIPGIESFDNIEAIQFFLVETGETVKRGHRRGYLLPMLPWETEPISRHNGI
jgi:lipopolysaccharide transport system ATP-binding protein